MGNGFDPWPTVLPIMGLALIALIYLNKPKRDPREPPSISSSIPVIGHLLGVMKHGAGYYPQLNAKYCLPIYTLRMPGANTIVVNSPELVVAVHRYSAVSVVPIFMEFTRRVSRPSKIALDILQNNLNAENGSLGYSVDIIKTMHGALSTGPDLDRMNAVMVDHLSIQTATLDALTQFRPIPLFDWVRHCVSLASTYSVYGPRNPFEDSKVENAFWALDWKNSMSFLNFIPYLAVRNSHNGYNQFRTGFAEYFRSRGHEHGSALIQARYDTNSKHGIPIEDMGSFELVVIAGLLINAVPAAFWTLMSVFSDQVLLNELRNELSAVIHFDESDDREDNPVRQVSITRVMETCPLLLSVFQENLRIHVNTGSCRKVLKDTLINNQYLFKQGSIVEMSPRVFHFDPSNWGPTAHDFNPRRFMPSELKKNPQLKARAGSNHTWGGGAGLCPGRHLATVEVVSLLVMWVLQYDMYPAKGEKWIAWKQGSAGRSPPVSPVAMPERDVLVNIQRRKGFEKGTWKFTVGTG